MTEHELKRYAEWCNNYKIPFRKGQKVKLKHRDSLYAQDSRIIEGKVIFVSERIFVVDNGRVREGFSRGDLICGNVAKA